MMSTVVKILKIGKVSETPITYVELGREIRCQSAEIELTGSANLHDAHARSHLKPSTASSRTRRSSAFDAVWPSALAAKHNSKPQFANVGVEVSIAS